MVEQVLRQVKDVIPLVLSTNMSGVHDGAEKMCYETVTGPHTTRLTLLVFFASGFPVAGRGAR